MSRDPYEVLGVSPDCSEDELKSAYRRLAKQYHPDLHPGDSAAAARMNEINAAYDQIKSGAAHGGDRAYAGAGPAQSEYDAWQQQAWQTYQQHPRYTYHTVRPGRFVFRLILFFLLFRLLFSLLLGSLWGPGTVQSGQSGGSGGTVYYYYYDPYSGRTYPYGGPNGGYGNQN